jgi:threonine dehydratase
MALDLLSPSGIAESHERIAPHVHKTPILHSRTIDALVGATVLFKCENFQRIGAFKIRGATNATALLSDSARAKGLATHSSGNHAQAVALAAQRTGIPAHIVMPSTSPAVKRAAVAGYGAHIIESGPTIDDRESTMERVLAEVDANFIHPYDDERVISGQATVAREILREDGAIDTVMGPVGGGGLMSGTCLSCHAASSKTDVIGCEPSGADDAARSFATGILQRNESVDTIADGLRTNLSERTFSILKEHLSEIITVTDEEIGNALRFIYERLKIVIEPSSAVPVAALIQQRERFAGRRIGIIVSGGNVDLSALDFGRWRGAFTD